MLKWKLFVTTLPFVAVMLGVKLAVEHLLGFPGWIDFSDLSPVLTAGTFLTGFMLAGTLADYKEAEKLPAELACVLESIEETFLQASQGRAELDLTAQRKAVLVTGEAIWDWLHKKRSSEEMYTSLETLGVAIAQLDIHGAGPHASRALRELHNLRRAVTRIGVISRTNFISSGYALLEVLTILVLGMTLIGKFKNFLTEVVLVPFITLIFVYMLRLIRDLDDPFEYAADGSRGAVEVELFPLKEYLDRLALRVGNK
ncbi:MAG: hypothetical protein IPK82_21665 [Polyangiaceae bacterium]|nr:hypothetical protein [Polyangiaceae bacterium]